MTQLSGMLRDQAQLQGVFRQLFDLGLEVVSFTAPPTFDPVVDDTLRPPGPGRVRAQAGIRAAAP